MAGRRWRLAVASLLALTVTGCGDDAGTVESGPTSTQAEAESSSTISVDEGSSESNSDSGNSSDIQIYYGESASGYDGERVWTTGGLESIPISSFLDAPSSDFIPTKAPGRIAYSPGGSRVMIADDVVYTYDSRQFAAFDVDDESVTPKWTVPVERLSAVAWTVGDHVIWVVASSRDSGPARLLTIDRSTGAVAPGFDLLPDAIGSRQAGVDDDQASIVECAGGAVVRVGPALVRWEVGSTAPTAIAGSDQIAAAGGLPLRLTCAGDTLVGIANDSLGDAPSRVARFDPVSLAPLAPATVQYDGEPLHFIHWATSDDSAAVFVRDQGLVTFAFPDASATTITATLVASVAELDELYLGDEYDPEAPFPEPRDLLAFDDDVVLPGKSAFTVVGDVL